MTKLYGIKSSSPLVAQMIAEQVFDNTLVAAGLMDDSRVMLPRLEVKMLLGTHTARFVAVVSLCALRWWNKNIAGSRFFLLATVTADDQGNSKKVFFFSARGEIRSSHSKLITPRIT